MSAVIPVMLAFLAVGVVSTLLQLRLVYRAGKTFFDAHVFGSWFALFIFCFAT
jgi:hypothetical protein